MSQVDAGGTDRLVQDGEVPVEADGVRLSDEGRDKLAAKIGSSLKAIQAVDDDSVRNDVEDAPSLKVPKDEDKVVTDDPGMDDSGVDEGKDADEDDDGGKQEAVDGDDNDDSPQQPTLPSAYRRSLKARGWTDEEVDSFWGMDHEKAMQTFDRIHSSRNAELTEFAKLGRQLHQEVAGQTPAVKVEPDDTKLVKVIDAEAIATQHGASEELVASIVTPVNEVIEEINRLLPDLREGIRTFQKTNQDSLGQQIETFFTAEEMKPYTEFYGKLAEGLSQKQIGIRNDVLELADSIRAGALYQGKDLSVEDALDAAHDSVSTKFQVQAVRKELKTKVKKRAAGVSLKPGKAGGRRAESGARTPARNRQELVTNVRTALVDAFGEE